MARPFVDAALLAAHGHSAAPVTRIRKGPRMSQDIRFALLPSLNMREQVKGFTDLNALARHIQRERGDHGLDLNEVEDMEIAGRPSATRGVEVWTINDGNDRVRFIGYAYLDGQGREALASALRRNRLVITDAAQAEAA